MDEQYTMEEKRTSPRRKKRTPLQIFKENYLPLGIAGLAAILILVFIIGSITRAVQRSRYESKINQEAAQASAALLEEQNKEVQAMLQTAKQMVLHYDYIGAVELIDSFSGKRSDFPELNQLYTECVQNKEKLVKWIDNNDVLNLSFQMLIADPDRAFKDEKYGSSYQKNFITVDEFTKILHALYENNYILIRLSDIVVDGKPQELYLPSGKKPLIITQTQVNYNTYMIDSDGDKLPDKNGDGFASKLILDANGNITCEIVDAAGQVQTGAYDLVPILNSFIATHPDFSYRGAKAILALTGYDGLFGYRTNAAAENTFGTEAYNGSIAAAKEMAEALKESGYELACYTYENVAYGQKDSAQIQYDLNKWSAEVSPILGDIDTLVFAKNSDISDSTAPYSGDKFETLRNHGFTAFLGFCSENISWFLEQENYIRMGRVLVTGEAMKLHPDWFEDFFNVSTVLDAARPS